MPKGVTYNQTQFDQAEAIADALRTTLGIPVINSAIATTTTAIATDGTSGDKTILTPSGSKALRISSLYLVMASPVSITLKKSSTAISGAMTISELAGDFSQPINLAVDQSFVINAGSSVAINGFVIWWEV